MIYFKITDEISACERQLKTAPSVKPNEPEALKLFAESLEKVLITLDDIHYAGSLNSLDTMAQLVNKLPFDLKRSWVIESVAIENRTGTVADFRSFVTFVINRSNEANSLFGRRVLGTSKQQTSGHGPSKTNTSNKAFSYNVKTSKGHSNKPPSHSEPTSACLYCKENSHKLAECQRFKNATLNKRSKFVKTNKFCYKCLSSSHRTFNCIKQNACTIGGCTGTFHHTLLHPIKQTNANPSATENEPASSNKPSREVDNTEVVASCSLVNPVNAVKAAEGIYLCVVPVIVTYGNKSVKTYAFLD